MIRNLTVLLVALFLSLLVVEVLVRFTIPQDLSGTWRVYSDDGLYLLNKSEGRAQHERGDRSLIYHFSSPHLRVGDASVKTEESGIPALSRALVLGDSFTFGWLLPYEQTYVSLLEQALSRKFGGYELLNAAAGGWGTADYLAYYEEYGGSLEISSVIVFLNTDDIGRAFKSPVFEVNSNPAVKRASAVTRSGLKSIVSRLPLYGTLLEHSHLLQAIRSTVLSVILRHSVDNNIPHKLNNNQTPHSTLDQTDVGPAVEHGKKLFIRLKELAIERGHRLIVVTTGWQAFSLENTLDPSIVFYDDAERFFAEQDIHFIDTSQLIEDITEGNPKPYSIEGDHHLNAKGSEMIVDVTFPGISRFLSAQ